MLRNATYPAPRANTLAGKWLGLLGTASRVELFLWFSFVALSPFYVFGSGMAQPADVVLMAFVGTRFMRGRLMLSKDIGPVPKLTLRTLGWMILVNLVWFGITTELGVASFALFYIFNSLGVLAFASLRPEERREFISVTAIALVSVGVLLAMYVLATNGMRRFEATEIRRGGRTIAFFNNPNQLAYYCVLSTTFVSILSRYKMMPKGVALLSPAFLLGMVYLTLLTASRAGMAAIVLATILGLVTNRRQLFGALILACLLPVAGSLADVGVREGMERLQRRVERDAQKGRGDIMTQMWHRGFGRFAGNEQYLILGAGEGAVERFTRWGQKDRELHSTLATMLFCYGVAGTILAIVVYWEVWRAVGINIVLLSPPILYGLTHNGLRQIELWILPVFLLFCYTCARSPAVSRVLIRRPYRHPSRRRNN